MNTESLLKILELESKKGYEDKSVFGGLDRFLRNWTAQATGQIISPGLLKRINKLAGSNYASLPQPQRKQWVSKMLNLLAEAEHPPAEKPPEKKKPVKTAATPRPRALKISGSQPIGSSITVIKGITTVMAGKFEKLGVKTVRDMLFFFPHRHIDYSQRKQISQLTAGNEETIIANVWGARLIRIRGRQCTEATVGDETGNIRVIWFNNPYVARNLPTNARVVISGRVNDFSGRLVFESPEWELLGDKELIHTARLVPVYSLTQGLYPRQVRKLVKEVVDGWAWQMADFLPPEIKQRCNLLALPEAIRQAHFPDDTAMKDRARVRLAFDELFLLQLGVLGRKREWQQGQPGSPLSIEEAVLDAFIKSLPFQLTAAQQKVLNEILADLQKSLPMSRLLQGEVGSGKTVVAAAALLMAAANGFQGALMAPTEILAEQHFSTIRSLLSRTGQEEVKEDHIFSYSGLLPKPLTVAILTGDIAQSKKRRLQQRILEDVDIAIGTHALIQKGVEFRRLGLVVVDEQHRFGVEQRSELRQKGFNPHMLVMTATPIPRTLALTLYGDLDLSVIDELPPGRQMVKTKWLKPEQRDSAYAFIRREVSSSRQTFIICPLVEESEAVQAKAAIAEYERLSKEVFPDLRLGLLHGRMSGKEKDDVMRCFRSGELHILVSTPVIEVGIDVPNATVMLVESADRFGLSQLHQFRGRVGRGKDQSYCMLLAENPSEVSRQRLDIIEKTQDGFKLAEEDLKLRGPGEFFGTRQSGMPDLRMAKLSDIALLELARREAIKLFEIDSKLEKPQHKLLAGEVARIWQKEAEIS